MGFVNFFSTHPQAVVEIEETTLRFLVPEGTSWKSRTAPLQGADHLGALRRLVPEILGNIHHVTLVVWHESGSRILPFPTAMSEAEILQHLELRREDYFGSNAGLVFALRPLGFLDEQNREYLVSSINRIFFNRLQNLFSELGYHLDRVTTPLEAAIGRFRQKAGTTRPEGTAFIISLGYSQIHLIVIHQGEVTAMRSALTGSVKELENRLAGALKLKVDKIEEYLAGRVENPDPRILEVIQQNMRELLGRISLFFASFRSREKEKADQTIYLSFPHIELAGLKESLEQSYSLPVKPLDDPSPAGGTAGGVSGVPTPTMGGMGPQGPDGTPPGGPAPGEPGRPSWLEGALHRGAVNLLPPKLLIFRFSLSPMTTWVLALFFLVVPMLSIKINHALIRDQIVAMRQAEEKSRLYLERREMVRRQQTNLQELAQILRGELPRALSSTAMLLEIFRLAPDLVRITAVTWSPDSSGLSIDGVTLDTATALYFWETLKKLSWLVDPKITFSPAASEFSTAFSIAGQVR